MILQQQSIIDKRTRPKFVQGRLVFTDAIDAVNDNTKFVTSEPILGGQHLYLRVKSGYKVAYVAFYDIDCRKRPLLRDKYYLNGGTLEGANGTVCRDTLNHCSPSVHMRSWIPAGAYARVVVCNADVEVHDDVTTGTDILPSDDFVEVFYTFDHVFMQPDRTNAAPTKYAVGKKLARQVSNCYTHSRVATINQDPNAGWYGTADENSICYGIFYSKVSGQRPGSMNLFHPSLDTYLSLWYNRRSMLYTERPMDGVSGYGITWVAYDSVQVNGRYPVGMVCNDAVATVFGMPENTNESIWNTAFDGSNIGFFSKVYDSMSDLLSDNASKLRSFDVCYTTGNHVLIITDIFKAGSDTFIEVFESSTDCQLCLFTPQSFYNHFTANNSRIYKIVRPKKAFYDLVGRMEYRSTTGVSVTPRERTRYVPNDDICTFAGDKATFASGDPIWLNVRQTNGSTNATFDSTRIYQKQDDTYTLVQTVSMSQPVSAHRATYPDNDVLWDIEVTSLFTDGTLTGLFEAKAYNSTTGVESEPTRFEVLKIDIANAYRVGLTANGSTKYDMLAILGDGAQRDGREAYVRALDSHYLVKMNDYLTYAHHLIHRHEEGKYNVLLAQTVLNSLTTSDYCQLAVKGEYGYALAKKQLTTLANLLSSATVNTGKYLTVNGNMSSLTGWCTYVKAISASEIGETYTLIYDDRVTPNKYMVVAQYTAADASSIGQGNLLKLCYSHRMNDGFTRETRMVDVKIEEGCTYIAVSCPIDDINKQAVVREMVKLPDLVRSEDVGYDMYFGWIGNPTNPSMPEDMTAASLLTYTQGYLHNETQTIVKTVTAADVAEREDKQLFFVMWNDNHPPQSGRLTSSGMTTVWDAASFEGSSTTAPNWNTQGNKQVTIGGTVYRVASYDGNFDPGDMIEINF